MLSQKSAAGRGTGRRGLKHFGIKDDILRNRPKHGACIDEKAVSGLVQGNTVMAVYLGANYMYPFGFRPGST